MDLCLKYWQVAEQRIGKWAPSTNGAEHLN
jgi:hypothetical protein